MPPIGALTRVAVEVGRDSTVAAPATDPARVAAVAAFLDARRAGWRAGEPAAALGGLHAHLWRGGAPVATVSLVGADFEFRRPGQPALVRPAAEAEVVECSRLLGLPAKVIDVPPRRRAAERDAVAAGARRASGCAPAPPGHSESEAPMTYNRERAGEFALALMYLSLHDGARAWKGYDWDVLDSLFEQGLITDPRSKARSVVLTDEGLARSEALFAAHLALRDAAAGTVSDAAPSAGPRPATPDATPEQSTLSELQRAQAQQLLARRCQPSPDPRVRAQPRIGYRFEGSSVVLFEARPHVEPPHAWREHAVARFRYVKSRHVWQLFCVHRDLRWHTYQRLPESPDLAPLVAEVDQDPTGLFWG